MKLKRNIAQFLSVGLLLNNIYFKTNASDFEIPNRYETLEGEVITIDDSTVGELHEIEIFGNTIQDENNLSDIQSIGDLYIDENGNPILDSQGREQYMVEIVSGNSILLDWDNYALVPGRFWNGNIESGWVDSAKKNNLGFTFNHTGSSVRGAVIQNVNGFGIGTYTIEFEHTNFPLGWNGTMFANINTFKDGLFVEQTNSNTVTEIKDGKHTLSFNLTKDFDYLWFDIGVYQTPDYIYGSHTIENIKLYKGEYDNKTDNLYDKTTILLPCQLQKVGNVRDRLYWDNEKGRYVIEKNIEKLIIDDTLDWIHQVNGDAYCARFSLDSSKYTADSQGKIIVNGYKSYGPEWSLMDNTEGFYNYTYTKYLSLIRDPKITTMDEFKEELRNNPTYILSGLKSPNIIPTNITSKLKVPTYKEKTFISIVNANGVNPILKVTIDRLPKIALEAIEEAENNPTFDNISKARTYTNMLPESLYKDQLQEQLSNVFSSDIILDRETITANLDVYIKSENMLSLSLDTSNVSFEDYSGIEPMEKLSAVNITINSSLPYDLNAYMPVEIYNADGTNKMDLDVLNIRESNEGIYKQFENTTDKVILKESCAKGNDINHSIDLKLDSNDARKADIYKTVIRFEVEQK